MAPQPNPVHSDETLPTRSDIIIIGGGIIGVTTALELAERGHEVTVLEKGIIAGEQSSRNWGWVRQMGRDPSEIPLIVESTNIWKGLSKRVEAETGYTQCGITYLLNNDKDIAHYSHWSKEYAQPGGITSQIIDQTKINQLFPQNTAKWKAGLYTADDGRAEPQWAAPAIAHAARKHGAKIFTRCAVRGIDISGSKVSGVVTEKGLIKASTIIIAGGAWSKHLCDRIGVRLPQLTTISSVLRTKPLEGPMITASGDNYTFRKRKDGGYTISPDFYSYSALTPAHFKYLFDFLPLAIKNFKTTKVRLNGRFFSEFADIFNTSLDKISPFEKMRILDPTPIDWMLDLALKNLKRDFPVFEPLETVERWAGIIDVTPDEVPIIDSVPKISGLFISTGFSGHGFGIGPGAGRLTADVVTGDKPCVDPAPFKYERFS